jgi:NADH:ubiquinone oxidoreductase subunit
MKGFILRLFTWWNGQTVGTQIWTALYGEFVGSDEFGNRYYRTRGGKLDPALGFERRWVVYNGYAEASTIPPSWHGWIHHTVDVPPTEETVLVREWEKPHVPNLTGSPLAYRPPGSTLAANRRSPATGDYNAWSPPTTPER